MVKNYFCIWFDEQGEMHERFFDTFVQAFDEARGNEISQLRYHWGDTQVPGYCACAPDPTEILNEV